MTAHAAPRSRAGMLLAFVAGKTGHRNAEHAEFDPVQVEAERYRAIYGHRSGAVKNIAPISVDVSTERPHPER